ncbi:unnamed protein product [Brachionus calyciflorus]|uniref:Uncharacterized protein n=1 Tax=Brachionus calyciflorus TaxID=104777 RepID=A0A813T8H4_9BILA|nr:unnamed protein product [Brachionus calyciflorus]
MESSSETFLNSNSIIESSPTTSTNANTNIDSSPTESSNPNLNFDPFPTTSSNAKSYINSTPSTLLNSAHSVILKNESKFDHSKYLLKIVDLLPNKKATLILRVSQIVNQNINDNSLTKILFTDGNEFITLVQWNGSKLNLIKKNEYILIEDCQIIEDINDDYFFKTNSKGYSLSFSKMTKYEPLQSCQYNISEKITDFNQFSLMDLTTKEMISFEAIIINIKRIQYPNKLMLKIECCDSVNQKFTINLILWNPKQIIEEKNLYRFNYFLIYKTKNKMIEITNCLFSEIILLKRNIKLEQTEKLDYSFKEVTYTLVQNIKEIENFDNIKIEQRIYFTQNIFNKENSLPSFDARDLDHLNNLLLDKIGKNIEIDLDVIRKTLQDKQKIFFNIKQINN